MSLQGCGNSSSEDGVSDVPLQYSNWEILVSLSFPFLFDGGTWTLWWCGCLLSNGEGIMAEGEGLLFTSFWLYLTTSENHTLIPIGLKDVCFQSEFFCCWGRKTVVLQCRSWVVHFQDVGVSFKQHRSMIWLDWNFTSDTRLSDSHLGFFWVSWVSFSVFLTVIKNNNYFSF